MPSTRIPNLQLNTGHEMPATGFGTWPLLGRDAATAVASAISAGYRAIDTAAAYENEDGVGQGLRDSGVPREQLFVTTKLRGSSHGRGKAREALSRSLDQLGLDYVDLYLIHWPNPSVGEYVEAYEDLLTLAGEGLIRSVGVSNFKQDHLDTVIAATGILPAVDQIQVSPTIGRFNLVRAIQETSTVVQAWSPLERNSGVLESATITEIATRLDVAAGQVVLRWLVQREIIPIPHSGNPARQQQNSALWDFELTPEDMLGIAGLDLNTEGDPDSSIHVQM